MTKNNKKTILQHKLYDLIQQCEDLIIQNMVDDGDTSETSQKICLKIKLNELDSCVNGIESGDMK